MDLIYNMDPQITRLQLKDGGTWECEMEEFKWGQIQIERQLQIEIQTNTHTQKDKDKFKHTHTHTQIERQIKVVIPKSGLESGVLEQSTSTISKPSQSGTDSLPQWFRFRWKATFKSTMRRNLSAATATQRTKWWEILLLCSFNVSMISSWRNVKCVFVIPIYIQIYPIYQFRFTGWFFRIWRKGSWLAVQLLPLSVGSLRSSTFWLRWLEWPSVKPSFWTNYITLCQFTSVYQLMG